VGALLEVNAKLKGVTNRIFCDECLDGVFFEEAQTVVLALMVKNLLFMLPCF
jgi:hypothetical protein